MQSVYDKKREEPLLQLNIATKGTITKKGPKFKFGVQVPNSTTDTYILDTQNGDKMWEEEINTEIKQKQEFETFPILQVGKHIPKGFKRIPYHLV